MARFSAALDGGLLRNLIGDITHAATQCCRVVQCENVVVVDFLSALRFRHDLDSGVVRVSYRSPTAFWLDCPHDVVRSSSQPLAFLWTHYWLAHRRADLAHNAGALSALQFARLCETYAARLHAQIPTSITHRLHTQLVAALHRQEDEFSRESAHPATSSFRPMRVERRSFATLLRALATDGEPQLNLSL